MSSNAFLFCQRIFDHVEDEQWNLYLSHRVLSVKGVQRELSFTINSNNFLKEGICLHGVINCQWAHVTWQQKFIVVFFAKLTEPMLTIPIEICMATHL